jgi:hypothetical protein
MKMGYFSKPSYGIVDRHDLADWNTIQELNSSTKTVNYAKLRALLEKHNVKGGTEVATKNVQELYRTAIWGAVLALANNERKELMTSYSAYYKGPGNSAASTAGKKKVAELNNLIKTFASTPQGDGFKKDLNTYFHGQDIGYALLNW